jgi:hypothetical protein
MKMKILILSLSIIIISCSSSNRYGCKANRCVKNKTVQVQQKIIVT